MTTEERRVYIEKLLKNSATPKKGCDIAKELKVTRQVIVKDVAILRAKGLKIIATPEGYMMPQLEKRNIQKIIPLSHSKEDIEQELKCIVKYGGLVKDVIIEHPLYGEIRAMLMIKSLYDIQSFVKKVKEYNAKPLSALTRGIHLHTVEADTEDTMDKIMKELDDKGYLIDDK